MLFATTLMDLEIDIQSEVTQTQKDKYMILLLCRIKKKVYVLSCFSHVQLFATLWTVSPPGSSVHGDSPHKNTGLGCHFLFQGIFPTQGSNPCLMSSALAGKFFITSDTWEVPPQIGYKWTYLQNRSRGIDIENKHGYQGIKEGRDQLGTSDWHIYTTIYKVGTNKNLL